EGIERLENVQELIAGAAQWAETAEEDDGTGDGGEGTGPSPIERYLTQAALVTSADQGSGDPTGVTLMTVHMAKGLEWPVVTLGGLEDGLFPLARGAAPADLDWEVEVSQDVPRYTAGERVRHRKFGSGVVRAVSGAGRELKVTVEFDDREIGTKQLLVAYAGLEREWESA